MLRNVEVRGESEAIGQQPMRLAADGVAFKLTAFKSENDGFEEHAQRLLRHVDLHAILWINVALDQVTFTSLEGAGYKLGVKNARLASVLDTNVI